MKEKLKYLLVSLGITAVGAGLMALGVHMANGVHEEFLQTPAITSKEELQEALNGSPQVYCLTDMEISGKAAEDPLEILTDDYAYIMYVKETCSLEKGNYTWSSSNSGDAYSYSSASDLTLFKETSVECPEDMENYNFYIVDYSELSEDMVYEEYGEKLSDNCYYPNKIEDTEGNIRYHVFLASFDEKAALYATVGDGKVVLEYNDDAANYIIPGGDMEALYDCHAGSRGMMLTLIGMMVVIPIGLIALLSSILSFFFNGKRKKK